MTTDMDITPSDALQLTIKFIPNWSVLREEDVKLKVLQ